MKKLFCILMILIMVVMMLPGCGNNESQSATTTVQGGGGSQQPQASGSSSAQASESSGGMKIKPEQLISKEDANKLIGEAVKAGVDDEYPQLGLSTCYYAPENQESKNYLQISILQKKEQQGGQSGGSESSSQPSESSSQSQSSGQQSESGGGGGGGEEMTPKNLYEGFKKIFMDANAAVTGHIGDDIFISGKSISILSGEYCIIISAGGADPAAAETVLKDAAEMAVGNLKRIQGK